MEHNIALINIVLIIVFGPMILFGLKCMQLVQKAREPQTVDTAPTWHDPEPLQVRLPFSVTCKIVGDCLPLFSHANSYWRIVNIEDGIPTTIAANFECIDESEPSNPVRLELGLIATIVESAVDSSISIVKLHFIPYEGFDSLLQIITDGTCYQIEKSLAAANKSIGRAQSYAEPPVVAQAVQPVPNKAAVEAVDSIQSASEPPVAYEPPAPYVMPEPYVMTEPYVAPAPYVAPQPEPVAVILPPPAELPAPVILPPPADVAAPTAAATGESLCPGCSQPINPAFPFCLYCGKNF